MNDLRNTFAHSVVLAFIMTVLLPASAVSSSLQKDLVNNQNDITVQPYELFVRSSINGAGGIHEFVTVQRKKPKVLATLTKESCLQMSYLYLTKYVLVLQPDWLLIKLAKPYMKPNLQKNLETQSLKFAKAEDWF